MIADLLGSLAQAGFSPDRVVLLGFSQGGCLALEFAARNARRYGAVIGLSAGLIGPDDAPRNMAAHWLGLRYCWAAVTLIRISPSNACMNLPACCAGWEVGSPNKSMMVWATR